MACWLVDWLIYWLISALFTDWPTVHQITRVRSHTGYNDIGNKPATTGEKLRGRVQYSTTPKNETTGMSTTNTTNDCSEACAIHCTSIQNGKGGSRRYCGTHVLFSSYLAFWATRGFSTPPPRQKPYQAPGLYLSRVGLGSSAARRLSSECAFTRALTLSKIEDDAPAGGGGGGWRTLVTIDVLGECDIARWPCFGSRITVIWWPVDPLTNERIPPRSSIPLLEMFVVFDILPLRR